MNRLFLIISVLFAMTGIKSAAGDFADNSSYLRQICEQTWVPYALDKADPSAATLTKIFDQAKSSCYQIGHDYFTAYRRGGSDGDFMTISDKAGLALKVCHMTDLKEGGALKLDIRTVSQYRVACFYNAFNSLKSAVGDSFDSIYLGCASTETTEACLQRNIVRSKVHGHIENKYCQDNAEMGWDPPTLWGVTPSADTWLGKKMRFGCYSTDGVTTAFEATYSLFTDQMLALYHLRYGALWADAASAKK